MWESVPKIGEDASTSTTTLFSLKLNVSKNAKLVKAIKHKTSVNCIHVTIRHDYYVRVRFIRSQSFLSV